MNPSLQTHLENMQMTEKSCCTADLSLLSNPNLEVDRASRQFIMMLKDLSKLLNDVTFIDRADCKGILNYAR